jgi:defect-in-organelle-trafficking protein DotC
MRKQTLNLLLTSCLLASCAHSPSRQQTFDTESLAGIQSMGYYGNQKNRTARETGKIRIMALKETALSLGAQGGLAWRAKIIDEELTEQARTLDSIYDFNALVLEHNILPPVLIEGRNILNLANAQTIRLADRTYKIIKQAHFITAPPTWRQYLWLDYVKPEQPNVTLLPKTKEEKEVWRVYTEKGWQNGIEQANMILEENLARIKEDFVGMILYRKLLAMNMVSAPYVSHTDLGITGDESELHIDDRVLRITALPTLNVNAKEWRAAINKSENILKHFNKMENHAKNSKIVISDKSWQPVIAAVN